MYKVDLHSLPHIGILYSSSEEPTCSCKNEVFPSFQVIPVSGRECHIVEENTQALHGQKEKNLPAFQMPPRPEPPLQRTAGPPPFPS